MRVGMTALRRQLCYRRRSRLARDVETVYEYISYVCSIVVDGRLC